MLNPPKPGQAPVPLKRSRDYLISRGALATAIVALLIGIPSIFVASFAYNKSPDLSTINSEIMILQSQVSLLMNSALNVTETLAFGGNCYLIDYSGTLQTTTFNVYTLNFQAGSFGSVVIDIDAFPGGPILSDSLVEIYCQAPQPSFSDFQWESVIDLLPSQRYFTQPMLQNLTFSGPTYTPSDDFSLPYTNYGLYSPVAIPPPLNLPLRSYNLLIEWSWRPNSFNVGVDGFNFNGKVRFGLAETPNLGVSSKKRHKQNGSTKVGKTQ